MVSLLHELTSPLTLDATLALFGGADFSVRSLQLPKLYSIGGKDLGSGVVATSGRHFAAEFNFVMGFFIPVCKFGRRMEISSIAFTVLIPRVPDAWNQRQRPGVESIRRNEVAAVEELH